MNREIKFRAFWENQMRHNVIAGNGQAIFIPSATGEYKWVSMAECAVMQFTGLFDINGKEIYEGDICRLAEDDLGSPIPEYFKGVVRFFESTFFIDNDRCAFRVWQEIAQWEVIGNVFENPELLS